MSAQITVEIREVYGNPAVYPICDKAKLFAELAGTKTLTPQSIKTIKALGFNVEVKQKQVTLASVGL